MAGDSIQITFPDGAVKPFPRGTTPADIARQISPRLAKEVLVARLGDGQDAVEEERLWDLARPLEGDTKLALLKSDDPDALYVMRHSCAHLLAAAVLELYPDVKLGIGPPVEHGFYYDFVRAEPFTPEDLQRIEAKMRELAAADIPNERRLLPRADAMKLYTDWPQQFKCELIEEKAAGQAQVSFYQSGKFIDFCLGPHIPSMGRLKAFKLMSIAGAYWKGQEGNPQMQRIYGACFATQQELDDYLHRLEEAKRRDHRKLGPELDLFSIQEQGGPGLIFWHPKGGLVRKIMEDWLRDELLRRGYSLVFTPHIMLRDLWHTSGHTNFYKENMFGAVEVEKADYQLKPMNCPGHILIYQSHLRSYRDLPVRLAELGTVYRYERSGVLHGLLRVRGFTQDDAHIFCMPEQIEKEIEDCVQFAFDTLKVFGFSQYLVELSDWDPAHPENYAGKPEDWHRATAALENTLQRMGVPYKKMPAEAAFYGPKIDVKLVDAIGRAWQLTTVQFDFNLPPRFGLEYVGEDGARHQPLMVHRALWGSVERFFGVLIEHYAGAFPAWLAPVQCEVLPVSEKVAAYAKQVTEKLAAAGFRAHHDDRNEKLQAKIRDAQLAKVPYMLIVGPKEAESASVSVRHRTRGDLGPRPLDQFMADLRSEVESRRSAEEVLSGRPATPKHLTESKGSAALPFEMELLPAPVAVTPEILEGLKSDDSFARLAFELYKEAAILLAVISHTFVAHEGDKPRLERNQAICAGLLVRLDKLMMAVMELSTKRKYGEIVLALNRSILETATNLRFLILKNEEKVFSQFVLLTLAPERELYDLIHSNIEQRSDKSILPIERRMLDSIERVCKMGGVKILDVDPKHTHWGGGLKNRLDALGDGLPYLAAQRIPSHAVHGTWVDLALHHLKEVEGGFAPDPSWNDPDARLFLPGIFVLEAARDYVALFLRQDVEGSALFIERIENLLERIRRVDQAHEVWKWREQESDRATDR